MDGEASIRKAYESILEGDYEAAISRFEAAIAAEPDNPDYYYKCSITCARSGKWAKAIVHAEEAVRLDEGNEEYRYHLNMVKARLLTLEAERLLAGKAPEYARAIAQLEKAVTLDPLLVEAYLLLGSTCGTLGDYDAAAAWLKTAVELDPGSSAARRWFAEYNRKRRARAQAGSGHDKRRKKR